MTYRIEMRWTMLHDPIVVAEGIETQPEAHQRAGALSSAWLGSPDPGPLYSVVPDASVALEAVS